MDLITDGLRIITGRGNEKIQWLHTGIAGAFGHNIKQLPVRLRVQLIEHNAVSVESVLVADIGRKHLVDTARWLIYEPLLGIQYLDPLGKRWTHSHHIRSHIEHDGRLLTVSGTAVDFGAFLAVPAGQKQGNGGSQFGFALFLGDFDICGIELPIAVRLENTENIPDNLFLPVDQFKGLSCPCAFGMAKAFNEHDGVICGILIVVGSFLHEPCRLVFLQFSRSVHLQGIKNSRPRCRCDCLYNEQQPLSELVLNTDFSFTLAVGSGGLRQGSALAPRILYRGCQVPPVCRSPGR